MKKVNLFTTGIVSASLLLFACGGATNNTAEESTEGAEMLDEMAEEMSMQEMQIDAANSRVSWSGEMLGIYSHEGTVNLTAGNIAMENGEIASGMFTVDMTSIVPTDENYEPEKGSTPEKLIGHLSSPDFFDVENHPEASFEITGSEGSTVIGMLTVRGKSGEERVENVSVVSGEGQTTISGTLTFNRKNYDVSFDHPAEDKIVSDDVSLNIELTAAN